MGSAPVSARRVVTDRTERLIPRGPARRVAARASVEGVLRSEPSLTWVVLTMGTRPLELEKAIGSIFRDDDDAEIVVVSNGGGELGIDHPHVRTIELADNVGAPGGRDLAIETIDADIVGFLDDDAQLSEGSTQRIRQSFAADERLGAVTLRLVDEDHETQRRHLPRIGTDGADESGEVTLILAGASAVRRDAYHGAGGYVTALVYAHEEVELCWRLVDRGWRIRYLADVEVFHPRTPIERHAEGWRQTGRNRVWIARRTLPWPVALVHVVLWLLEGARRAPSGRSRREYVAGWMSGWSGRIERSPISWRTVWRLTRLGRPPIV